MGDVVRIIECRPLSRLKRWELGDVVRQAVQVTVDHPALEGTGRYARQEDIEEEVEIQCAAANGLWLQEKTS